MTTPEEANLGIAAQQCIQRIDGLINEKDPDGLAGLKTYAWQYIKDALSESKLHIDGPWIVRCGLDALFDWDFQTASEPAWTVKEIDDPFSIRTKRTLRDIGLELQVSDRFPVKINYFEQQPESVDVFMALKVFDEERFNEFLDDLVYQHS